MHTLSTREWNLLPPEVISIVTLHVLIWMVEFRMAGFVLSGSGSGIRVSMLGNMGLGGWGKVQVSEGGGWGCGGGQGWWCVLSIGGA